MLPKLAPFDYNLLEFERGFPHQIPGHLTTRTLPLALVLNNKLDLYIVD